MNLIVSSTYQQTPSFQGNQVLSRQEAKSRLHKLIPGSEEYNKLQNALIKATGIAEISLPTVTYKVDCCLRDCKLLGGFGSSEHVAIGEGVILQGLQNNTPLLVKGVTPVRFPQIIALAGDFYGVPGKAVSLLGGTKKEKTERFKKAFDTLAQADNHEIRKILLEIDEECTSVKNSSLPHHCYSSQLMEKNNAIKKIKNDVDELLYDNSDHFSENASDTYFIGHDYALSKAREAGKNKDLEGLKLAYAIDAFACHFLTDLFSAGHTRNQRGALESFLFSELGFPKDWAKPLAGILTAAQHEKDGNDGLNVYNTHGDYWRAYGDGCFFGGNNSENKKKVIEATQKSVDEIYYAYLQPDSSTLSSMSEFIPKVRPDCNPLPLYTVEGSSLFLPEVGKVISKGKGDFLNDGISQALRYLPQNYIDSYVDDLLKRFVNFMIKNGSSINFLDFEMPPVVDKGLKQFIYQINRFEGAIWRMVGVATYIQVHKESQQLKAKIDEMATELKTTHTNSCKVLDQMKNVQDQLGQLVWHNTFKEISESIATIKDEMFANIELKDFTELQIYPETKLWDALKRLLRVFTEGLVDNRIMLKVFTTMLKNEMSSMDHLEITIAVTLWFRSMLDYQAQAFRLYVTIQARKGEQNLHKEISSFKVNMVKQVEANKDYIDVTLIYQSPSYIKLQLEKCKIKKKSLEFFKTQQ